MGLRLMTARGAPSDDRDDGVDFLNDCAFLSARISVRRPAAGAGISASDLVCGDFRRGARPSSTLSPTFLSHMVMVPSKIDLAHLEA